MLCCARPPAAPAPGTILLRGGGLPVPAEDIAELARWAAWLRLPAEAGRLPAAARASLLAASVHARGQAGLTTVLPVAEAEYDALRAALGSPPPVTTALHYVPLARLARTAPTPQALLLALVDFGVLLKGSPSRTPRTLDEVGVGDIAAAAAKLGDPGQATAVAQFLRRALGVREGPVFLEPRDAYDVVVPQHKAGQLAAALLQASRRSRATAGRPLPPPTVALCEQCRAADTRCALCLERTTVTLEVYGGAPGDGGDPAALADTPDFFRVDSMPMPAPCPDGVRLFTCPAVAQDIFSVLGAYQAQDTLRLWCALGPGHVRYALRLADATDADDPVLLGQGLLAWTVLSFGDFSAADSRLIAGEQGFAIVGHKAGGSFVLVAESAGDVVVAFRGTPSAQSEIQNDILGTLSQNADVVGKVHAGFQAYLDALYDGLVRFLGAKLRERRLFVTGHSLGGAAATLLTARLCGRFRFTELGVPATASLRPYATYTYGCPRTGDADFATFVDEEAAGRNFRYINQYDPVTELPLQDFGPLGQYHHCGTPRCLRNTFSACGLAVNPSCLGPHIPYSYFKFLDEAVAQDQPLDAEANPGFTGLDAAA